MNGERSSVYDFQRGWISLFRRLIISKGIRIFWGGKELHYAHYWRFLTKSRMCFYPIRVEASYKAYRDPSCNAHKRGMKDKGNVDGNTVTQRTCTAFSSDTRAFFQLFPPSIYMSLGYSCLHLFPGDTGVTFLSERRPSSNFSPAPPRISPLFTLAKHEKAPNAAPRNVWNLQELSWMKKNLPPIAGVAWITSSRWQTPFKKFLTSRRRCYLPCNSEGRNWNSSKLKITSGRLE